MKLADLCTQLEAIAPLALGAEWDNNGLLVGDPSADVARVLLTIDLTDAVLDEAFSISADAAVCYHPPIFKPLRQVRADRGGAGARVYRAIRGGLALFAMHTTLDAAAGGTNDALADVVGITDARPLQPHRPAGGYKLVTFVPADAVDAVADAVFAAGAGRIGDYTKCSYRLAGTGTFLGGEDTHPALGQAGQFETVEGEVRIETVVPQGRAAEVVAALRRSHPYEEVAFDLHPLAGLDERIGMGRVGRLADPAPLGEVVDRVKKALGVEAAWLASPDDATTVNVAAVGAGSCGDMFADAVAAGADLYVTGEIRHHDALAAVEAGMAVLMLRHSVSERHMLARLADRLRSLDGGPDVVLSERDADPFRWA